MMKMVGKRLRVLVQLPMASLLKTTGKASWASFIPFAMLVVGANECSGLLLLRLSDAGRMLSVLSTQVITMSIERSSSRLSRTDLVSRCARKLCSLCT